MKKLDYAEMQKYTKRNEKGKVVECAIIAIDGTVIKYGPIHEVEDFFDENHEIIFEDRTISKIFCAGKEVHPFTHGFTNFAKSTIDKYNREHC